MAEFIKVPQGEPLPRDQRHLLNKLSFQATLWLPCELSMVELSKRLQNTRDAKTPFQIILLARQLSPMMTSLEPQHVTFGDRISSTWRCGSRAVMGPGRAISSGSIGRQKTAVGWFFFEVVCVSLFFVAPRARAHRK